MKLYTESEVRKAIELSRDTHPEGRGYMQREEYDYSMDEVIDLLTPIELPSDEEIYEASRDWVFRKNSTKWSVNDDTAGDNMGSFLNGAKWMRNKIERGGNNEQ